MIIERCLQNKKEFALFPLIGLAWASVALFLGVL